MPNRGRVLLVHFDVAGQHRHCQCLLSVLIYVVVTLHLQAEVPGIMSIILHLLSCTCFAA